MLGLRFQDNSAKLDAALDTFIDALGNTAGDDSAIRKQHTGRRSRRGQPDRDRKSGEEPAAEQLKAYVRNLAATLGFEIEE